ncbi:MAG: hypothetical protein EOL97_01090 [Spirochaetia bacterium]|nr:hypothetical protein [Spirochaetia bacterium]
MKKGFIIFIMINLSYFIYASDFNIATSLVINSNNYNLIKNSDNPNIDNINNQELDNYNDLLYITDLCNNYLSQIKLNDYFIKIKSENDLINEKELLNEKLSTLISSYSQDPQNDEYIDKINTLNIEIDKLNLKNQSEIDFSKFDDIKFTFSAMKNNPVLGFLLNSKDSNIISNLLTENKCDGFLLISFDKINDLNRVKIEYLDNNKKETIYNKIIKTQFIRDNTQEILISLINYFNSDYSLVKIKNKANSINAKEILKTSKDEFIKEKEENYNFVKIKESELKTLKINNEYLILEKNIHFIKISDAYSSKIIKIDNTDSDFIILDLLLDKKIIPSINIISNSGYSSFKLNGKTINSGMSLNLENQILPFYVEVEKEDYAPLIIQNIDEIDSISFKLKPLWMNNSLAVDKAQDKFYSTLLSYVFINFTTLAINNINDAYGTNEIQSFLDIFSTSVLTLSSINIVYKLISYIKLATT